MLSLLLRLLAQKVTLHRFLALLGGTTPHTAVSPGFDRGDTPPKDDDNQERGEYAHDDSDVEIPGVRISAYMNPIYGLNPTALSPFCCFRHVLLPLGLKVSHNPRHSFRLASLDIVGFFPHTAASFASGGAAAQPARGGGGGGGGRPPQPAMMAADDDDDEESSSEDEDETSGMQSGAKPVAG